MQQNVHAKKRFGQHFLKDEHVLANIVDVSGVTADDTVLEIGPGTGALTLRLAARAKKVIAVEIDESLRDVLDDVSRMPRVTLLFQDILKTDLNDLCDRHNDGKPFHVVANLPYNITTPVLLHLLTNETPPLSLTVMVQKETALRMCALPGNKDYGALSILVQFYADPRIAFDVSPQAFSPRPAVESSVLTLSPLERAPVQPADRDFFFFVVRNAFAHRRKTLVNSLSASGDPRLQKDRVTEALKTIARENVRAEQLTMEQFARLSDFLYC